MYWACQFNGHCSLHNTSSNNFYDNRHLNKPNQIGLILNHNFTASFELKLKLANQLISEDSENTAVV